MIVDQSPSLSLYVYSADILSWQLCRQIEKMSFHFHMRREPWSHEKSYPLVRQEVRAHNIMPDMEHSGATITGML